MRAFKVVAEVYPSSDAEHFADFACAGVAFYVSWAERFSAKAMAEQHLSEQGWTIARFISEAGVRLRPKAHNEARIIRAIEQEFHVCNLHRVKRLTVGPVRMHAIPKLLERFARVAKRGIVVLVSDKTRLATATIDDQEVIPLWSRSADALEWSSDWTCQVRIRRLNRSRLLNLLRKIPDSQLLAVAVEPESLVTMHPAALIKAIQPTRHVSRLNRPTALTTQKRRTKLKKQNRKV